jgi:hypothetical protein
MIEIGIISFLIGTFGTYTALDLINRKKTEKCEYEHEVPLATLQ